MMNSTQRTVRLGGCASSLISLLIVALGLGILYWGASPYLTALHFAPATCTILDSHIQTLSSQTTQPSYLPVFLLRVQPQKGTAYQTQSNYGMDQSGQSNYSQVFNTIRRFQIGHHYSCWYDPQNPSYTILDRSPNLLVFVCGGLFFLGGCITFLRNLQLMLGRWFREGLALGVLLFKSR